MSASLKVLKSAALLFSLQLVQRGLGIVSTLILARLLTPEHFGIVALVTIALQFFELLVETGNQQYIIQKDTLTDDDLNTAWSMDLLIKSAITLVIIASSPWLAAVFDTPELALALAVASLSLPVRALRTPGIMKLAREINYRPLFHLTLWQKLLSFGTVITIAWVHPSHWAIIAGTLVSSVILAIGSYRVHDFRPRWTLIHLRQQWKFSQWLLMRGLVGFTRSQIDNLMVSRLFGTHQLGGYNLVREVSLLPALSAIIPMSEPLLAAIAQSRNDESSLAYRVRLSLALMITLLIPITTFIMLYPELIIRVLLGPQWAEYAHLLRPFGLFFFTFCLFALISDTVIALGRVQALFWFDVISTATIVAILWYTATGSLDAMAWARGWLAVATTLALLVIVDRWSRFGLLRLIYLCLPGAAGAFAGGWLVVLLPVSGWPALPEFLARGFLFVSLSAGVTLLTARLLTGNTEEWQQLRSLSKNLISKRKSPAP